MNEKLTPRDLLNDVHTRNMEHTERINKAEQKAKQAERWGRREHDERKEYIGYHKARKELDAAAKKLMETVPPTHTIEVLQKPPKRGWLGKLALRGTIVTRQEYMYGHRGHKQHGFSPNMDLQIIERTQGWVIRGVVKKPKTKVAGKPNPGGFQKVNPSLRSPSRPEDLVISTDGRSWGGTYEAYGTNGAVVGVETYEGQKGDALTNLLGVQECHNADDIQGRTQNAQRITQAIQALRR